jgi:hypothetical protein
MSGAYTGTDVRPTKGQTLDQFLQANELGGKLDLVALFNWGTKDKAQINRALVELVGCSSVHATDPLQSVLDPDLGTTKIIRKPTPWAPALEIGKLHTVKLKKRLPATAVAITELTSLFDPESAPCTIKCRFEGDKTRADKREFEVHATAYFDARKGREGDDVEAPAGTRSKDDLTQTDIVRKKKDNVTPGEETISWDGKATEATFGVLKNSAKIISSCAPYHVLVRYYKDDADKDTRIKLQPFYVRFKVVSKGKREVVDESLVVKWKLEGDPAKKLKHGQLVIIGQDDEPVFIAPLDRAAIEAGSYDLVSGAVKIDKTKLVIDKMPFRAQIQAHSDMNEESGLAIATMPTQVPAYNYKKVQMIAFNVKPDTHPSGSKYLGDSNPDVDIAKRAEAMIEAIQKAKPDASTDMDVLKVFMAPEFYWRGDAGAYPIEKIGTILPAVRKETDKFDYIDWLFVCGTAIGRQKHEDESGDRISHGLDIHRIVITSIDAPKKKVTARVWSQPAVGWVMGQGPRSQRIVSVTPMAGPKDADEASPGFGSLESVIEVADVTGFAPGEGEVTSESMKIAAVASTTDPWGGPATKIKVASKLCSKIPFDRATKGAVLVGGKAWEVESGGEKRLICTVDTETDPGFYWLTVYPAAPTFAQGAALLLNEPIATEVTNVALIQKGWPAPHLGDKSLRDALVYKEYVSPIDFIRGTGIDRDAFLNMWGDKHLINIDGDPDRAVLPTEGSTDISGANPNVKRDMSKDTEIKRAVGSEMNVSGYGGGIVYTIDGVTFGLEVCLDHAKLRLWNFYLGPNKQAAPGDPKVQVHLVPSWGMSIGGGGYGNKRVLPPNGVIFNVDGARTGSVARLNDGTFSCDDHPERTGSSGQRCQKELGPISWQGKHWFKCGGNCKESNGDPKYYVAPGCPTHGKAKCGKPFAALGSEIVKSAGPTDVPKSADPKYFSKKGHVLVYPPKDLPDCDVVT